MGDGRTRHPLRNRKSGEWKPDLQGCARRCSTRQPRSGAQAVRLSVHGPCRHCSERRRTPLERSCLGCVHMPWRAEAVQTGDSCSPSAQSPFPSPITSTGATRLLCGSGACYEPGRVRPAQDSLGLDIEGVDRLARGHEQAVALRAAETHVGAALGQQDAADHRAVGCEDGDPVLGLAASPGAPEVAVRVDPETVAARLSCRTRAG